MNLNYIDTTELVGELLDHAPLAVAWKDTDCVFRGCNEAFARLAGLRDPEEIVGRTESELQGLGEDDGAADGRDRSVLRTGRTVGSIETRRLPGGELRRLMVTRIRAKSPTDGGAMGLLLLVRVASAEASLELDYAQKPAVGSEDFLRRLGHEIRTPMTALLGFAGILRDEAAPGPTEHGLHVIERSGMRVLTLIDDLLDLARIESGRAELRPAAMNPHRVLQDVVEAHRPRAMARNVHLRLDYLSPIPDVIVSDSRRLTQLLGTLIDTASQLSDTADVSLQPAWIHESGREWLQIRVVDTGDGLPPELLEGFFEPFQSPFEQTPSALEESCSTGLGLVVARHVARLLGGELAVESTRGAGTTFSLRLDPGVVPAGVRWADGPADCDGAMPPGHGQLAGEPLEAQRVLLAEDDDDNSAFLQRALRRAGAEVTLACDGQEAVEMALAGIDFGREFDVVVLNTTMPRLDGLDAAMMLRELGCEAPLVAMSADHSAAQRERCALAGCDDFLPKPILPSAVVNACAQWVGPNRRAA